MNSEQQRVMVVLRQATSEPVMSAFDRSIVRQCQQDTPETFLRAGLQLLLGHDSAGRRFLEVLLVWMPEIFQELTNRWTFSKDQAVKLTIQLQRVDPNFDTRMIRLLPDRNNMVGPFGLKGDLGERALEILDEIAPGRRIVPMMRHLTDNPNAKLSSKAAILIGKRLRSVTWANRVITEAASPRIRANALEAMWDATERAAIDLFRTCLKDQDNRVVGNALVGLHRAGALDTKELVASFAVDGDAKLRMTAAWAMGQIGDPSFGSFLAPLVRDGNADVRRAALRSLKNLRMSSAQADALPVVEGPATTYKQPEPVPETPISRSPLTQRQFWR